MSPITTGVVPPPRSRNFTERDAREAHAALVAYQEAGTENEGVGYGNFNSAESARSAGASLNKMMSDLGLTNGKWATTVFPVEVERPDPENPENTLTETKYQGVLLPKAAKVGPPKSTNGGQKRSGRKAAA